MNITLSFKHQFYKANLGLPIDISLPLMQGKDNVNCYYAQPFEETTIEFEEYNFIGNVKRGGVVNYTQLHLTPHGNGTHTECLGHISPEKFTVRESLQNFFFFAQVVSVKPEDFEGDQIVRLASFKNSLLPDIQALIIRTLPNEDDKKRRQYSNTNPPYLEWKVGEFLKNKSIEHLLLDLPSVDRESDKGALLCHRAFWNYPQEPRFHSTITELIFVPNQVQDGLYLLNLQCLNIESDASPSRPVLFKMEKI